MYSDMNEELYTAPDPNDLETRLQNRARDRAPRAHQSCLTRVISVRHFLHQERGIHRRSWQDLQQIFESEHVCLSTKTLRNYYRLICMAEAQLARTGQRQPTDAEVHSVIRSRIGRQTQGEIQHASTSQSAQPRARRNL